MFDNDYNDINNPMYEFVEDSPSEMMAMLAERLRQRRLEKNLSRKALAELSGVPVATLARFEQQHVISMQQFVVLVAALGYIDQLKTLMSEPRYKTLSELETIKHNQNRKRGRVKTNQ